MTSNSFGDHRHVWRALLQRLGEEEPRDRLGFAACDEWDRRHPYVWFRVPPGGGDVYCEHLLTGGSKL
jgi:hypothetical protein